ncbi:MAG: histidine kinase [Pseudomonadota bacterium]|nr:histidine kinase [Pseudomonadota bacterium]
MPKFSEQRNLRSLLISVNVMALFMCLVSLPSLSDFSWHQLAKYAFFTNWVAITCAVLTDVLRQYLIQLPRRWALFLSFLLFVVVVGIFSLIANLLLHVTRVVSWQWSNVLVDLNRHVLLGGMLGGLVLHYLYLRERLVLQHRAELLARVQALQTRIRPHFLFNSMNTLSQLVGMDAARAEQAIQDISALFRASLNATGEISLSEELETCEHYLALEKLRLGERLQVEWRLPDEDTLYDMMIPALTLQPLLENAVYHGIEHRSEPSVLSVLIEVKEDRVTIVVTNPCQAGTKTAKGNRIALDNIEQRLKVYYGSTARLMVYESNGLFTVYLSYPQDSTITSI